MSSVFSDFLSYFSLDLSQKCAIIKLNQGGENVNKGERIRKARENCGITQEELAKKINTTKQTIHKYETGVITNIPSDKIELIASTLNLSPSYLMGWEEQKNNDPIIVAAAGGGLTDVDERFREILKDKQTLCETIFAANLDKRQIKELIALVKTFEKL